MDDPRINCNMIDWILGIPYCGYYDFGFAKCADLIESGQCPYLQDLEEAEEAEEDCDEDKDKD